MIISIEAVKTLDKSNIQYLINTLSRLGIEWNFHRLLKIIHRKPTVNVILNGERLNAFPEDQKQGTDVFFHPFIQHGTGGSSQCTKVRKRNMKRPD